MYTVDEITKRMSLKVSSAHVSSEMFFINLILSSFIQLWYLRVCYMYVHLFINIDCLFLFWHSDPESDNSDSSDSDFEPEKEVNDSLLIITAIYY